jgi:hypothetical protein
MGPGSLDNILKAVSSQAEPPKYIRAYHGSPYDFDRFDASKIGTGEGAQAYGHGLYFAGEEAVSKGYRDSLSGQVIIDGKPMPDSMAGNDYILANALANKQHSLLEDWKLKAQQRYDHFSRKTDEARARYQQDPEGEGVLSELGRVKHAADLEADVLAAFKRFEGRDVQRNAGRMYEVQIAHPEQALLDWDATLDEQQHLLPAAERAIGRIQDPGARYDAMGIIEEPAGNKGRDLYGILKAYAPESSRVGENARFASRALMEEGIPGLRYLDGLSRRVGQGSRNYVTFPGTEDSIRILRKYGIMAPVAAGTAMEQR